MTIADSQQLMAKSFPNSIWHSGDQPLFLHSQNKLLRQFILVVLTHGVTVALQILVLSVKVRILMGQQEKERFKALPFLI